jgi:hypothetical protein
LWFRFACHSSSLFSIIVVYDHISSLYFVASPMTA